MNYEKIVNQAIDYILDHLDEPISVQDVADYCYVSRYHFNRIFKSIVQESVYQFIKRVKIEQAAFKLMVEDQRLITDIGLEYGYESANFTNVFKQQYKNNPYTFKQQLKDPQFMEKCSLFHQEYPLITTAEIIKNLTFVNLDSLNLVYKRYVGSYQDLPKYWQDFRQSYPHTKQFYEISYSDPTISDENRCIMDLCCLDDGSFSLLNQKIINQGLYAKYVYEGKAQGIYVLYQSILRNWVVAKQIQLRNEPMFIYYLNWDCPYFKLELYIPIIKKH